MSPQALPQEPRAATNPRSGFAMCRTPIQEIGPTAMKLFGRLWVSRSYRDGKDPGRPSSRGFY